MSCFPIRVRVAHCNVIYGVIVLDYFRNAQSTPQCLPAQRRYRLKDAFFNTLTLEKSDLHERRPNSFISGSKSTAQSVLLTGPALVKIGRCLTGLVRPFPLISLPLCNRGGNKSSKPLSQKATMVVLLSLSLSF